MLLLIGKASSPHLEHPLVGQLIGAGSWWTPSRQWAADNDAFTRWDAGRWRAMLERVADVPRLPLHCHP